MTDNTAITVLRGMLETMDHEYHVEHAIFPYWTERNKVHNKDCKKCRLEKFIKEQEHQKGPETANHVGIQDSTDR